MRRNGFMILNNNGDDGFTLATFGLGKSARFRVRLGFNSNPRIFHLAEPRLII